MQSLRQEEERLADEDTADDVLLSYDRPENSNKVTLRRTSTGTWEVCFSNQTSATTRPARPSSEHGSISSSVSHGGSRKAKSVSSSGGAQPRMSDVSTDSTFELPDQRVLRLKRASLSTPKTPGVRASARLRGEEVSDPDYKPSVYNQRKYDLSVKRAKDTTGSESATVVTHKRSPGKKSSPSKKGSPKSSPSKDTPIAVPKKSSSLSDSVKKDLMSMFTEVEAKDTTCSSSETDAPSAARLLHPESLHTPKESTGSSQAESSGNSDEDFIGARTRQRHLSASLNQSPLAPVLSLLSMSASSDSLLASKLLSNSPEKSKSPSNHKYPTRHKLSGTTN